jgi:hypothetical protein
MYRRAAQVVALATAAIVITANPGAADTEAAKVTSAAIRAQGHACTDPVTAQRDPAASRPDQTVWLVACRDGRYRVQFMGEARPRIERLP